MIPFNKPYATGKELDYIQDAIYNQQHISGNGKYTKMCHNYFQERFGFKKCLLTTSCTDALEMTAILMDIKPGDEVIVPSFTFVSSALAFVRQGARIIFCDSRSDHPGMNEDMIEELITPKTKAVVVVHYAGVACDMDKIMRIASMNNLFVVEDAAQAIDSYYKGKSLGSIGHFGCFSFHETKNINCGEGGMLVINDERFIERSEIIWEKGTNRAAFFRGQIDKYGWVDNGSSFLPSEINAAYLYAQIEALKSIQEKRCLIWNEYQEHMKYLEEEKKVKLPYVPDYATNNGHMFYIICKSLADRSELIDHMRLNEVHTVFHYQSLHRSPFYFSQNKQNLHYSDLYSDCLIRLPFYFILGKPDLESICSAVTTFFS
jgi:dTDP-4-amino-4,6-dideoxygalactose transaminase